MIKTLLINEPAYAKTIKTIGIGKKGSRSMDAALVNDLRAELGSSVIPQAALGAILGSLMIKGLSKEEEELKNHFKLNLFDDPSLLIDFFSKNITLEIKHIYIKLISKQTLSQDEAYQLGMFLFTSKEEGLKGLAASIMRVRYETEEEYAGLLNALKETFSRDFKGPASSNQPIIQIAEPFDGVDHSYLITPLVAKYFIDQKYNVLSLVGRNAGPKNGNNLLDLAESLKGTFLKSNNALKSNSSSFGWFLHQKDLSAALDQWVNLRRQIIKRPFLSTIERFVNPADADIVIASAFHPPYGEKMLRICERANYKAAIIVRNGIEGTTAFPLLRPAKILCTVKSKNTYKRFEFEYDSQKELKHTIKIEERIDTKNILENTKLIEEHFKKGYTHNAAFDARVQATSLGLKQAVDWIQENE